MGGPLKFKFANHFIIYQKRPLRGHLGLAGYTQSSGTGELNISLLFCRNSKLLMIQCGSISRKISHRDLYVVNICEHFPHVNGL